jgi:hypothetical protein
LDVAPLFSSVIPAAAADVDDIAGKLGTYDSSYNAATSGRVFGSLMVAARADAYTMLNPCLTAHGPINTVVDSNTGGGQTVPASTGAPLNPCGQLALKGLGAQVSVNLPFLYAGNDVSTVTWQSRAFPSRGFFNTSVYHLQLWDGGTLLNEATGDSSNTSDGTLWQTAQNVQLTPGHSYAFRMALEVEPGLMFLGPYTLSYGGTAILPQK